MKNIAICYSEHAIKVSDSYCSGPSGQAYTSSHSGPSVQNAVTCVYKVKQATTGKLFLVRLTWSSLWNRGLSIGTCDFPVLCSDQFRKRSRVLRKEKGWKGFEFGSLRVEVLWDLCRARYEAGPEPVSGFYVVVLVNSEVSVVLGDVEEELEVKKRVFEARVSEFWLISRSEQFSGSGVYSTRAKFCDAGTCHDIVVRCLGEDKSPVLSVYIDKKNVIQVKRLQWNFRGNQTIFLDGLVVDLMWDVHDLLFSPNAGNAVFMFRTRSGLDSRLWLEEKSFEHNGQDKTGFSLLIYACKNPD